MATVPIRVIYASVALLLANSGDASMAGSRQGSHSSGTAKVNDLSGGFSLPAQWDGATPAVRACLARNNASPQDFIARGVGPDDPIVQQIVAKCSPSPSPVAEPMAAPTKSSTIVLQEKSEGYAVEGLSVGGYVSPDSAAYRAFACHPSVDFAGFSWCVRQRSEVISNAAATTALTILHSAQYQVALVMKSVVPAFFAAGDIDRDVQRLSARFGPPSGMWRPAAAAADARSGILVAWGAARLSPLDELSLSHLRAGEQIHRGLIVDFLGDAQASARQSLPVYVVGGGAGFLYSATTDPSGKGSLRMSAVNAAELPDTAATATATVNADHPVPSFAPVPASTSATESNSFEDCKNSPDIALKKRGGTYSASALIDGNFCLEFMIDSGASDVSIPWYVFETLKRTGKIQDTDLLGTADYTLANGTKERSIIFNIRSLKIGNREVNNILGSAMPTSESSLLLGQSFFNRFKSWSIDNERDVLLLR